MNIGLQLSQIYLRVCFKCIQPFCFWVIILWRMVLQLMDYCDIWTGASVRSRILVVPRLLESVSDKRFFGCVDVRPPKFCDLDQPARRFCRSDVLYRPSLHLSLDCTKGWSKLTSKSAVERWWLQEQLGRVWLEAATKTRIPSSLLFVVFVILVKTITLIITNHCKFNLFHLNPNNELHF